ncbi:MAG: hypothetical protein VX519_02375 [Myxococcota bacterium]|nr:hypothetical protein [Myxococcota bacterium]
MFRQLASWIGLLLSLGGLLLVLVVFAETVSGRWSYGFDLEWMEGGMLVHVQRLREGLPLYVEPGPDFIPYIYPPLYPWVLSMLGEPSYWMGRGVSICSTLGAAAAIVAVLRLEKVPWMFCLGAAAGFMSCYDESGSFFDLVRGDSLGLLLASWSLVLVRRATRASVVMGGLLLLAAYLAKHNYALLGLPMLIWLWTQQDRQKAVLFCGVCLGSAVLVTAGLTLASEGRFLTYLLGVPAMHPFVGDRAWPGAQLELVRALPWLSAAAGVALLVMLKRHDSTHWSHRIGTLGVLGLLGGALFVADVSPASAVGVPGIVLSVVFGLMAAAGCLRGAWSAVRGSPTVTFWLLHGLVLGLLCAVMRGHHGGFINVLMPGFWLTATLAALLLARASGNNPHPLLTLGLGVLFVVQAWTGRWDVDRYTPTEADREAGVALLETIESYDGEVLMPHSPWYPTLVGKRPSFPLIALWDVAHDGGPLDPYVASIRQAFAEQRWDAVILTTGRRKATSGTIGFGMAEHYQRAAKKDVFMPGKVFWTRAGWRVRPRQVWEANSEK